MLWGGGDPRRGGVQGEVGYNTIAKTHTLIQAWVDPTHVQSMARGDISKGVQKRGKCRASWVDARKPKQSRRR